MLYRQIILEWGQDTESGVWGLGYSPDNGKNFYVLNTTHGRKYRAEDGNRLYPYISDQIQDKIDTVVAPAKSAADSAQSAADAAVASAQVTSDAVSAIASATAEAKQGANDAMSRAKSAWDVATGAKEAVTDFDPLLKSVQSDAGKALTQIADTASALSDAKTAFGSDVAEAKNLASTAQTTANSAVESAGENAKALASQANALSDAKKAMDSDIANTKELANAAQATADNAVKSASSVADDLETVASQAKANASGITKVTSDVGLLQTTVADNSGNISKIQETAAQLQQAVSDNSGNITIAKQTADSAVAVASDARSNATVAIQTASQASITANNASGQAASAVFTASGAMATASNAESDATVAIQTASGASLTATNAQGDATIAKQTASEATVQASNAESDFAQLSIRANKIEANVADNSGSIASVQQTANGLTTTVADIKANGGGRNLWINSKSFQHTNVNAPKVDWNTDSDGIAAAHITGTGGFYGAWQSIYANNTDPFAIGDLETFSVEMKGTGTITIGRENDFEKAVTLTNAWARYSVSGEVKGANRAHIIYNESGKDCDAYVRLPMVEKGMVAHDWSPAPDDLQNQFTQTKESIDGVTTTINDPKTGLNAIYQTAAGNATTISNVKSDVAQLETTATGLTSRVGNLESKTNTQETAIEQNKTAIALKADQTEVDNVKGTVTGLQSSLTVQGNQIQTKVSASDVSGMLKGYATQDYTQSLVTQQANTLSSTITTVKNQVNSLESTIDWTTKTGSLDMDTLTTTQNIYYRDTNLKNADGEAGWAYIHVVSMGERVTQTVWHDRSSIQHTRTGAVSGSSYNWDAWNRTATNAQISNLTQSLDGLRSTVATKADQSTVTQLSNLVQAKVSSDDFTSTTTQLKDMINQRVQVGDVISQINQEAGGDTLIQVSNGKKSLILDAENTIITGEAWIPSAAISSISADKIMLGSSALYNSDGTLNLVNQSNGLKALIQVKQGQVQDTTQSIISFSSDYNNRAFSVTPVGATITPTLFFERYDQTAGHWLGFTRNEVRRDGLMFHTWDDEGERFFVGCHARFDRNISANGNIYQGTWNGTNGKPLAGVLSIQSGNTIWSGSDFLAIGDHLSNSFTNVMARSFSQQSTLSSKTNIETVDPKDALDLVNRTDIRSYQYKTDVEQGKTKRYTSLIIDDVNDVSQYYAPNEFTNEERTGRDDGSAVGYLFLAIQELTRRIKTLEDKLNG